jgi:hypothetical protein
MMHVIDDAFVRQPGKAQREDLRKARSILAEGGVPALRRYVEKYGSAGLPAVMLGMLGLQAAQQPREGGA